MKLWIIAQKKWVKTIFGIIVFAFFLTVYTISMAVDRHYQGIEVNFRAQGSRINKAQLDQILQKYQEIGWYTKEELRLSHQYHAPSFQVFGKSIPDFDRTILSLRSLDIFLHGRYVDYLEFINGQEKKSKLSWDEFKDIQSHARVITKQYRMLSHEQIIEVLKFALVLDRLASSSIVQNKAWIYEIVGREDRRLVKVVLEKHPDIFPYYSKLNLMQQRFLHEIFALIDLNEVLELGDMMRVFVEIRLSNLLNLNPELFELAFFLEQCRLAGASGDINSFSSQTITTSVYQNFQAIRMAFSLLKNATEKDAFKFYLAKRALWLGVDPGSPLNRVLTRFGAMMELYQEQEGKILKEAFLRLPAEELALIVKEFDEFQTPTYQRSYENLSLFLRNLSENRNVGQNDKERLAETVKTGISFLAKVAKICSKEEKSFERVDLSAVSVIAITNPELLQEGNITFDKKGKIHLIP
jgi:hypothetical protein